MASTVQHPRLSEHIQARQPSAIRIASIKFDERTDDVQAINVAIGNVSLAMHPAMIDRMKNLDASESPFRDGVVKYTATVGTVEARNAVLNVIASSGFSTQGLHCQITDGGSQAMELLLVACCGPAGSSREPLLLIDAAYTNYKAFASRLGRSTASITRTLGDQGKFSLPSLPEIEQVIERKRPGALVVIPYDNPTGHFYNHETMVSLAHLCVKHNLWMVSDEAYRELFYTGEGASSIWGLTEEEVPGITGRRISIETASKVWNACGLRIGALVTDNRDLHERCVAENTASLCSSAIGQYVFGALAHESHQDLQAWYAQQRDYYHGMMGGIQQQFKTLLPELIVSSPEASIYTTLDVRRLAPSDFDALQFVLYCASEGAVATDQGRWTLLTAPMAGFYSAQGGGPNPGRTQMRVAFVQSPEEMARVPSLFTALLKDYLARG